MKIRSNWISKFQMRRFSVEPVECQNEKQSGVVVGVYQDCGRKQMLTDSGEQYDDANGGVIKNLLKTISISEGTAKVLHNIGDQFYATAVSGLGEPSKSYSGTETMDMCKESIRLAAAAGARALQDSGIERIYVEGFRDPEAAAEGANLAVWRYQEMKGRKRKKPEAVVDFFNPQMEEDWIRGNSKAQGQNLARYLAEQPANIINPMAFAQAAIYYLCPCGVKVEIRNKDWMEEKRMIPTLAMSKGSCESPLFLEMFYCGGTEEDKPVVLVGKGVTFDSGGLCLRPCQGMGEHRGDVAGGAAIVGVLKACAALRIPINVVGLVPLIENMPGGAAMKPGDVVITQTGRTIKIQNPAYAGHIILAASLVHAASMHPCLVIDVATLLCGAREAMGSAASPTFCTSDIVWKELQKAGAETGDRFWRMPFWEHYSKSVTGLNDVDVDNVGLGRGASLCKGAAFLLEFAPKVDFTHIDISGTGMEAEEHPIYYRKGLMTGRPVRSLVQFLNRVACPHNIDRPCK